MKIRRVSLTAATMMLALVGPVSGQRKVFEFGFHGSYLQAGTLAQNSFNGVELSLDNKGAFGGGMEWWFGQVGLRGDMSYSKTPWLLEADDANLDFDNGVVINPLNGEVRDEVREALGDLTDIKTWMWDANLMVRILPVEADRWFAPFVSAGGGMIIWDHPGGPDTEIDIPAADAEIVGDSQSEPAFTLGLGTDIFFTHSVALRLEARDYWNPNSPYIRLSSLNEVGDVDSHHDGSNNFLWTMGLQFAFGGHAVKEPGFIAEALPPEPPPPAPPATEMVGMCVVGADGRLQTVAAKRYIDSNQIVVLSNGSEVAFSTAYPSNSPTYVKGNPWYVANRPLIVDLNPANLSTADRDDANGLPANRMEFVNYGSTQPMAATDLVFVGTINGTPLYARPDDVGGFATELDSKLRVTSDLDRLLEDKDFAQRFGNEIQTFYVPVEPGARCVFQPMSSTHVVRRTRG